MRCPSCGASGSGNFCSRCGSRLDASAGEARCAHCGSPIGGEALFCAECGQPTGPRPRKSAAAYLPWGLAGLALVAFSVAIAIFVQSASTPRTADMPLTGGVPAAGGEAPEAGSAAGPGPAMPTAEEIAAMSPRQAADRLFDRAMTEQESGDPERAQFFAQMALQAYGQLEPAELDSDVQLHLGLLQLVLGNPAAARAAAQTLLDANPNQLFGLLLQVRAAEAAGDEAAAAEARGRFGAALAAGETPELPEYEPHRTLLQTFAAELPPSP